MPGRDASQVILGNEFRLTKQRGVPIKDPNWGAAVATVHPSAILRTPDHDQRDAEYKAFVEDLRGMRELMNVAAESMAVTGLPAVNLTVNGPDRLKRRIV